MNGGGAGDLYGWCLEVLDTGSFTANLIAYLSGRIYLQLKFDSVHQARVWQSDQDTQGLEKWEGTKGRMKQMKGTVV